MEAMELSFWRGKRVLVTGHTGFKGSWLSLWLLELGAAVTGLALEPDTEPSLFRQLGLEAELDHHIGDVRDKRLLGDIVGKVQPEIVFHLAAQSLVRRSCREPLETWKTNVLGTLHLMESLRQLAIPCAAVLVTTDKVYRNREDSSGYHENDPLGGADPYSASKAAMELAIAAWRSTFFPPEYPVRIASARSGNVIGGGDWSEDRIMPDLIHALIAGRPLKVRNSGAIRPWQHVLDPLSGYMLLARRLYENTDTRFQDAFNFGPGSDADRSVSELLAEALTHWQGGWEEAPEAEAPRETGKLILNTDKVHNYLGWEPRWDFRQSVRATMEWYRDAQHASHDELRKLSLKNIADYVNSGFTVCA